MSEPLGLARPSPCAFQLLAEAASGKCSQGPYWLLPSRAYCELICSSVPCPFIVGAPVLLWVPLHILPTALPSCFHASKFIPSSAPLLRLRPIHPAAGMGSSSCRRQPWAACQHPAGHETRAPPSSVVVIHQNKQGDVRCHEEHGRWQGSGGGDGAILGEVAGSLHAAGVGAEKRRKCRISHTGSWSKNVLGRGHSKWKGFRDGGDPTRSGPAERKAHMAAVGRAHGYAVRVPSGPRETRGF